VPPHSETFSAWTRSVKTIDFAANSDKEYVKSQKKKSAGPKKKTTANTKPNRKAKAVPKLKLVARAKATSKPKLAAKPKPKIVARPKILKKNPQLRKGLFGKFPSWLWSLGIFGSPLLVAIALWRVFSPLQVPEPAQVSASPNHQITIVAMPPVKPAEVTPDAFVEATRSTSALSTGEKMAWWSDRIDQAKEILSSVKKPEITDSAPLWPLAYDCTTFVETVLALARTQESKGFYASLLAIRYRAGRHDFFGRNHFPEVDWIPGNIQVGILKDITVDLAQAAGKTAGLQKKSIRKQAWFHAQLKSGRVARSIASEAAPDWSHDLTAEVPYVKIADVAVVASKIPTGTVINLVRADSPKQPVVISHQGFVIQEDGKTFIRHSTPEGHLRKDELVPYLNRLVGKGKWPLVGVNLNAPV